jgi:hypothetical protein
MMLVVRSSGPRFHVKSLKIPPSGERSFGYPLLASVQPAVVPTGLALALSSLSFQRGHEFHSNGYVSIGPSECCPFVSLLLDRVSGHWATVEPPIRRSFPSDFRP